jgi:8-oxo-dGTP diphosphatase
MKAPVPLRRVGYRIAHRLLRLWWFAARPQLEGVKCVLTDDGQVLLVLHTYGRREWDVPGGTMRRGEPPLEAARREMEEELGVRLDMLRSVGELRARPYRARDTIHLFHAELSSPELTIDRGELAQAEWFPRAELPSNRSRYLSRILALVS